MARKKTEAKAPKAAKNGEPIVIRCGFRVKNSYVEVVIDEDNTEAWLICSSDVHNFIEQKLGGSIDIAEVE